MHKKGWSITRWRMCKLTEKEKMRRKKNILLVIMENSSYDAIRGCLEEDLKQYNVLSKCDLHGLDDNGVGN